MPAETNLREIVAPDYLNDRLGPRARRVNRRGYEGERQVSAVIDCRNLLSFSVNVGADRHCHPRSNIGPWERVEVTDLNRPLVDLRPYRDEDAPPFLAGGSRYYEVPVDLLNRIIARNGGLRK